MGKRVTFTESELSPANRLIYEGGRRSTSSERIQDNRFSEHLLSPEEKVIRDELDEERIAIEPLLLERVREMKGVELGCFSAYLRDRCGIEVGILAEQLTKKRVTVSQNIMRALAAHPCSDASNCAESCAHSIGARIAHVLAREVREAYLRLKNAGEQGSVN